MKNEMIITKHAYDRMKERQGLNKKATARMAELAYKKGVQVADMHNGSLLRYINYQTKHKGKTRLYCYGEFVYVFTFEEHQIHLVTVLQLPARLKNQSLAVQRRSVA